MKVVITGATGNVGTSLLDALAAEPEIEEIVALARRRAILDYPRTRFETTDISRDDLQGLFAKADAVVHLAWLIQPSRDDAVLSAVNVTGTRRVLEAAAAARIKRLVYASSVGAYSPAPKDRRIDESWPTEGIPSLFYSRHKAAAERMLDQFERDQPSIQVTRLRPALIFKRQAATGIRRLFAGRCFRVR